MKEKKSRSFEMEQILIGAQRNPTYVVKDNEDGSVDVQTQNKLRFDPYGYKPTYDVRGVLVVRGAVAHLLESDGVIRGWAAIRKHLGIKAISRKALMALQARLWVLFSELDPGKHDYDGPIYKALEDAGREAGWATEGGLAAWVPDPYGLAHNSSSAWILWSNKHSKSGAPQSPHIARFITR